eukprot:NP_494673.1 Uncharacterized protein CELE_C49D10.7 [Caenorhabditis elegans]
MEKEKSSKRLDLQGIRGIAIIVVLGFHFFPDTFPNGYLGILRSSKFLMTMLLKRSENQSAFSLTALFYLKMFKQILPLYLLCVSCVSMCVSMIALYNIFPDTAVESNKDSALSDAIDIFTHTWSLSVEIQFYLLHSIHIFNCI